MKTDKHQHSQVLMRGSSGWTHSSRILVALVWGAVALAGASIRSAAQETVCVRGYCYTVPQAGDVAVNNGAQYAPQRKAVFEVRDHDQAGVDCTGNSDSSPFLKRLTATADTTGTSLTISTRGCTYLRADGWLIHGQEYLEIDLGPKGQGQRAQGGTTLFGCSGSGAVLTIDRSGYTNVHGGTIAANHFKCPGHASSLTGSIEYTNSGPGGYTSTHNVLADTILTSGANGEAISGYKAYYIHGAPNQEAYRLQNVDMNCQGSPNSDGFYSDDWNADSTTWDGGGVAGCYHGINMTAGLLRISNLNNSGNGGFSVFGSGGASIFERNGCVTSVVQTVWAEGSGQFMNMANDSNSHNNCGSPRYWRDNQIGFDDIDPSVYPVNLNSGSISLAGGNVFYTTKSLANIHNRVLIGTDDLTIPGLPYLGVYDLGGNGAGASGAPLPSHATPTNGSGRSYSWYSLGDPW